MSRDYRAVLERLREHFQRSAGDVIECIYDSYDSPIEKVFIAAMVAGSWMPASLLRGGSQDHARLADIVERHGLSGADRDAPDVRWFVNWWGTVAVTQHWLSLTGRRIRPDIAFIFEGLDGAEETTASKVIVELDGHDFHERTPEQARSDKSRDRELQRLGWRVMRFTGREVLDDPEQCLHEVSLLLHGKAVQEKQRRREQET